MDKIFNPIGRCLKAVCIAIGKCLARFCDCLGRTISAICQGIGVCLVKIGEVLWSGLIKAKELLKVCTFAMREVSKEVVEDMENSAIVILEGYGHIFEAYIFAFFRMVCTCLASIIKYICTKIGQCL